MKTDSDLGPVLGPSPAFESDFGTVPHFDFSCAISLSLCPTLESRFRRRLAYELDTLIGHDFGLYEAETDVRDKRTCEPLESRWSSPPEETRDPRGVTFGEGGSGVLEGKRPVGRAVSKSQPSLRNSVQNEKNQICRDDFLVTSRPARRGCAGAAPPACIISRHHFYCTAHCD
ncbi:hypothetical protein EVAR_80740_1 [Eumeta japonica]|uniref:Uncharacterized protein n=1 Tax=Eumeta variegata TaxID=151549 RepID=A0A4C1U3W4_EUMVA|nr:hypothetical protein EVAR_80740_1 [Eumeta japonica]